MSALVSICIPTFNGANYLKEALDSVKAQSYKNIELVISDDASVDNTLFITEEFKQQANFPVFIYNHSPNGIGANWNNCIKKSNGKYIKFLFQDDILEPECIYKMVSVMEQYPQVGLVASKRQIIYDKGLDEEVVKEWLVRCEDLQKNLNLKEDNGLFIVDKTLFNSEYFLSSPLNKIGEPSVILFKKSIITKIGFFREDLKQILDYEFCYRALLKYNIAIINEKLVKFRLHEQQATQINRNSPDTGDGIIYHRIIYKKYLRHINKRSQKYFIKKFNLFYRGYYFLKEKFNRFMLI